MDLAKKWMLVSVAAGLILLSPVQAVQDKPSSDDDTEVIEVVGKKGLNLLKTEYKSARREFRTMFNDLVEDDRFKVRCKKRKRHFSNIIVEACRPAYYWDAFHDRTEQALWFGFVMPTAQGLEAITYREKNEYNETLMKMLKEKPELQKKFFSFLIKQHKFMDAHVNEFGSMSKYKSELERSTKLLGMLGKNNSVESKE